MIEKSAYRFIQMQVRDGPGKYSGGTQRLNRPWVVFREGKLLVATMRFNGKADSKEIAAITIGA